MATLPQPTPSTTEEAEDNPLRIFVFDTQRTSAQLFSRQLLSHLQCGSIHNPYAIAATLGPERIQPKLHTNARAKQAWEDQVSRAPAHLTSLSYQAATERFLREADRLEASGKTLFKTQPASPTNSSPSSPKNRQRADSVLSPSTQPPSLPAISPTPIIIDAADVLHNTHALLTPLFKFLNLPIPITQQESWIPTAQFHRAYSYLTKTISENLLKAFSDRLRGTTTTRSFNNESENENTLSLPHEHALWIDELGPEIAQAIRKKVGADLPHYEYLKIFKLRVRPSSQQWREGVSFREDMFGGPSAVGARLSVDAGRGQGVGAGAGGAIWRSASLGQVPVGLY